jgi:3-oxoacyl-[acyl-carrier protein] reductase
MRLKGKTALFSGASRNIGREIAVAFAWDGTDVVLVTRTISNDLTLTAKSCERLGARVLPVAADVGDHEHVNRAVQLSLAQIGKVDAMVSVAAIRPHKPFWEVCAGRRYM